MHSRKENYQTFKLLKKVVKKYPSISIVFSQFPAHLCQIPCCNPGFEVFYTQKSLSSFPLAAAFQSVGRDYPSHLSTPVRRTQKRNFPAFTKEKKPGEIRFFFSVGENAGGAANVVCTHGDDRKKMQEWLRPLKKDERARKRRREALFHCTQKGGETPSSFVLQYFVLTSPCQICTRGKYRSSLTIQ